MKFLSVAAMAAACLPLIAAQQLATLPPCAKDCAANAIPQSCKLDAECICKAKSFIDGISCCVYKACNKSDQDQTLAYARGICTPVNVTDLPTSASCSPGNMADGSSSSEGSTATTSAAASTSSASSAVSAKASSASSSASSVASSARASASGSSSNSANNLVAQGMGVVGAAVLGAAALI